MGAISPAEVVICGSGIAGISAAYDLAVRRGLRDVVLVDPRQPLTLTSDKSTECYRNWWPGPDGAMIALMNRSIDLLESLARRSGNIFSLNRRGYLYVTCDPDQAAGMEQSAREASYQGAGELRVHTGQPGGAYLPNPDGEDFNSAPAGADLLVGPGLIRAHFPDLSPDVQAALHVRRAGWLSAQQLGAYLLSEARRCGVRIVRSLVTGIETRGGRIQGVRLEGEENGLIPTGRFINAAGPLSGPVARLMGIELPLYSELHLKLASNDPLGVVPRDAPLLILNDSQRLLFSAEEQAALAEDEETRWLLDEFPGGLHTRPEGGPGSQAVLILWPYHTPVVEPAWPVPEDLFYPEVLWRGLERLLPEARKYFNRLPRPSVDGGYYTRTRENRPLIGPLPVEGAYLIAGLSGFGIMAACGSGELLGAHLTGGKIPEYAPAFLLDRYQDREYLDRIDRWSASAQL